MNLNDSPVGPLAGIVGQPQAQSDPGCLGRQFGLSSLSAALQDTGIGSRVHTLMIRRADARFVPSG